MAWSFPFRRQTSLRSIPEHAAVRLLCITYVLICTCSVWFLKLVLVSITMKWNCKIMIVCFRRNFTYFIITFFWNFGSDTYDGEGTSVHRERGMVKVWWKTKFGLTFDPSEGKGLKGEEFSISLHFLRGRSHHREKGFSQTFILSGSGWRPDSDGRHWIEWEPSYSYQLLHFTALCPDSDFTFFR
jgi:hypothetical protein